MVELQRSHSCPHPHRPAKVKIAISNMGVLSHLEQDDADMLRSAFLTLAVRSPGSVAISNKIDKALELVKSHVLYAVREEVHEMQARIDELLERNHQLDRENAVLRAFASPETLEFLRQHRSSSTESSTSSTSSSPDDDVPPSPQPVLRQSSLPVHQQLQALVSSAYPSLTP